MLKSKVFWLGNILWFLLFVLVLLGISLLGSFADTTVLSFLVNNRVPVLDQSFLVITHLAGPIGISVSVTFFTLFFLLKKRYSWSWGILLTALATLILVWFAKDLFKFERPPEALSLVSEDHYSFPSGHAAFATAFYGYLILILFELKVGKMLLWEKLSIFGLFLIAVLICFSRLYLGAHYLSDVIGGIWLGVFTLRLGYFSLKDGSYYR